MKTYSKNTGIVAMLLFSLIIWGIIPFLATRLDVLFKFREGLFPGDSLIGIIFLFLGIPLSLYCVWLFLTEGNGTAAPISPPKHFVVRGPYKYVRNPMILGGWFMILGEALILHSVSLLLFAFFILMPAGIFAVIFHEEPSLEKRFGEEYAAYKRTTRRWIPRL
jgi:protein-S-isoprenylcysteine O-methyltransferase Ste14